MRNVLTILIIVLMASASYGAVGDVHDYHTDFSNVNNPNGLWSYHVGQQFGADNPYDTLSSDLYGDCGGPAWGGPAILGPPHSRQTSCGGPAVTAFAAAFGATSFAGHNPFMARWTVPAGVAAVSVLNHYRQDNEVLRQMRLIIKHNGSDKMNVNSIQPAGNGMGVWTDPNAISFNVAEGDTIDIVVDGFGNDHNGTGENSPQFGTGTTSQAAWAIKEIAQLPEFNLEVTTNPANITSVTNFGLTQQPINQAISMVASDYAGCLFNDGNIVYTFDSWTGPVDDVNAASTTITSTTTNETLAVTANYVVISECLDTCHPSPTMDFNDDCITDVADFGDFAADWMSCTQPACID